MEHLEYGIAIVVGTYLRKLVVDDDVAAVAWPDVVDCSCQLQLLVVVVVVDEVLML